MFVLGFVLNLQAMMTSTGKWKTFWLRTNESLDGLLIGNHFLLFLSLMATVDGLNPRKAVAFHPGFWFSLFVHLLLLVINCSCHYPILMTFCYSYPWWLLLMTLMFESCSYACLAMVVAGCSLTALGNPLILPLPFTHVFLEQCCRSFSLTGPYNHTRFIFSLSFPFRGS
uniref:Uncharacterized protein n=1 Tax=Ananas comosus var. bracteatus TaxID=296719 RepID=A0A6V7PGY3_ANACO|nr:unnamed protein product [Ananas comosus var. bracteatus]